MYIGEKVRTLEELRRRLISLAEEIHAIGKVCGYYEDGSLLGMEPSRLDAETFFLRDMLSDVLCRLDRAVGAMDYLCGEIMASGVLRKMPSNRYAVSGWGELTCGSPVEILMDDDYHFTEIDGEYQNVPYWRAGRIEHNGTDYYFTGAKEMPLEGVQARIRR